MYKRQIKGFDSKIEAMDIFIELMRSTAPEYINEVVSSKITSTGLASEIQTKTTRIHKFILALRQAPLPSNDLYSRDYWDFSLFYSGRGFVFNPYVLENENRLVITPVIKLYSLKEQFETVLKAGGYTVVDEPTKAQMIISVESLYYGTTYNLKTKALPIIKDHLQEQVKKDEQYRSKNLTKETQSLTDQASMASSMGNADAAKGFAGVAAANLVLNFLADDDNDNGYFISNATVKMNGQGIFKSPNYLKLADRILVQNQVLCLPQTRAFMSSRMFLKSIDNKLSELK